MFSAAVRVGGCQLPRETGERPCLLVFLSVIDWAMRSARSGSVAASTLAISESASAFEHSSVMESGNAFRGGDEPGGADSVGSGRVRILLNRHSKIASGRLDDWRGRGDRGLGICRGRGLIDGASTGRRDQHPLNEFKQLLRA